MSLTAQPFTFYAGDTTSLTVALLKDGSAFTPGTAYNLIFTAKRNLLDEDRSALFQYSTGVGVTHSTTNAVVAIHPIDTRYLGGKTLQFDIKAQDLSTGNVVATVAIGTLVVTKNVGRLTTTSVQIHTATAGAPYGVSATAMAGAITAAATITPITGDELAPALSGGVLGKFTYTAIKTWILAGVSSAWADITGKPTTLAGYGITDAEPAKGTDDNYVTDAEKANIGNLSTAAYTASTNYATAAQGALAASASQPGHTHSGVYAASSHTHVSADVTDASTGGNGATDSGKLVKFGGEGGGITFAGTNAFGVSGYSANNNGVRASSSTGNALSAVASGNGVNYHATFGNSGDDRSFVDRVLGAFGWWRGAYSLMVSAADTLTANRHHRFPDKADGTIALTSDITGTNSGTNTGDQDLSGLAVKSANLFDLASASTARTNLGLGNVDDTSNATERAATATLTNKTLTNPVINSYVEGVVAIGNSSTSQTIALTAGTVQTCTLTGNCTFTMPTATAGKSFVLYLNTGAGSLTGTFTGVKWPGGTAPTITATASRMDILSFVADGTNWYGSAIQNYTP